MKLFILGLLSGTIGGMGIGGGAILIPALIFTTALTQHEAQGINLIVFIPIAIVALITHFINKNISFEITIPLVITGVLGAFLGSRLAISISPDILRKIFSFFLLSMGLYEIISKPKKKKTF